MAEGDTHQDAHLGLTCPSADLYSLQSVDTRPDLRPHQVRNQPPELLNVPHLRRQRCLCSVAQGDDIAELVGPAEEARLTDVCTGLALHMPS